MTPICIQQFERETVANYSGRGKSVKTTRQFRQVLRELRAVGVATTGDLTDTAILAWIAAFPDRTVVTFRSHLRALSTLCRRACKKKQLETNPFDVDNVADWMRSDSRPRKPRRRWSKPAEQIRAMLALADDEAEAASLRARKLRDVESLAIEWDALRRRAYARTLFQTGARPGEIQRLRIEDFSRRAQTIEIVAHWVTGRAGKKYWWEPKTEGSAGLIPIGDKLAELLDEWARRVKRDSRRGRLRVSNCEWLFPGKMLLGPWTSGGRGEKPLDQIRALGERAGVTDLTQKAARKGIGTYADIGLSPQGRRKLFRHSDDAIGDAYDEMDVDSRRGDAIAIERFFTGT
jgi:integrase